MKAKLFTDGGSRGNPGPAAYAFVLEAEDGTVLDARGEAIGVATNNVAEYAALVAGLERAVEAGVDELEVVSDSELMVKQMRGEYRVKNRALQDLFLDASRSARKIRRVTYTAVRREHNVLADSLVNEALDASGLTESTAWPTDTTSASSTASPEGRFRTPPVWRRGSSRSGRTASAPSRS